VIRVPLDGRSQLKAHCGQIASGGKDGFMLVSAEADAGVGEIRGLFADTEPVRAEQTANDEFKIRSETIELTLRDGRIVSLIDLKLERELIPKGQTGGLVIFRDTPNYWCVMCRDAAGLTKSAC
jgi:alpha-mannosidase